MKIRAFIVEDEPEARRRLRALLAAEADIEIVGESDGSKRSLTALRHEQPDLIVFDLETAASDGFTLLRQTRWEPAPAVIVISTRPDRAAEAFEHEVTDYLVQPYPASRLQTALVRVRAQLARRPLLSVPKKEDEAAGGPGRLVRFVIRGQHQLDVIKADEVDWMAAAGNYVVLHSGRQTHVLRESLLALERRLDPAHFMRISRTALVNLNRIKSVKMIESGAEVALTDGTQLPLTRGIRDLQSRLELG